MNKNFCVCVNNNPTKYCKNKQKHLREKESSDSKKTISVPSTDTIPLGGNKIFSIGDVLYYRSNEGTITILGSN